MSRNNDGRVNLDATESDEARRRLAVGEVVRIVNPRTRKVYLCTSIDDVRAAQRGSATTGAVRLDGSHR